MEAGARSRQETRIGVPTNPAVRGIQDVPRIGSGWVAFAGTYLALAGMLNLIWGITALSNKDYFIEDGLVWSVAEHVGLDRDRRSRPCRSSRGGLLFARKVGGVIMAIVITMCGMLVNFLSIGAYPCGRSSRSCATALVLWAVTVHGNDFT